MAVERGMLDAVAGVRFGEEGALRRGVVAAGRGDLSFEGGAAIACDVDVAQPRLEHVDRAFSAFQAFDKDETGNCGIVP